VEKQKELTDAELILQIEKQAELEERKNRYKKIDFASLINREQSQSSADFNKEFFKPLKQSVVKHSARK
jgi:hypothetical protein